jgi:hypothetical protein
MARFTNATWPRRPACSDAGLFGRCPASAVDCWCKLLHPGESGSADRDWAQHAFRLDLSTTSMCADLIDYHGRSKRLAEHW